MFEKHISRASRIPLLAVLAAAFLFASPLANAQTRSRSPEPDRFFYPLVGVTPSQTVRLNLTHIHAAHSDGVRLAEPTVRAEILFVNLAGETVGIAKMELPSGASGFVDLPGANILAGDRSRSVRNRSAVRIEIRIYPPDPVRPGAPSPGEEVSGIVPCMFPSSVEVFDNVTGETSAALENPLVRRAFNPQPEPPASRGGGEFGY